MEPASWDIGGPQPAVARLALTGGFGRRVLDVGCGVGENALLLAALGHDVVGVDAEPENIARCQAEAGRRGVAARFEVQNGLALDIRPAVDTILDSCLFHCFQAEDRPRYVDSLRRALRPGGRLHILAFSTKRVTGRLAAHRLSAAELCAPFTLVSGWKREALEPVLVSSRVPVVEHAWLATFVRT